MGELAGQQHADGRATGPLAIASRPLARLAGLLIFVLPATFLAIMGPAIILILQNIAAQSD